MRRISLEITIFIGFRKNTYARLRLKGESGDWPIMVRAEHTK